jgi:hypothetical protein
MATIDKSKMDQYVDGKLVKSGQRDATEEGIQFQWWQAEPGELGAQVDATVKFLQKHQGSRIEQLTHCTRLYGNSSAFNTIGTAFSKAVSNASNPNSSRISFNLCQSVVDTLVAKISKNKVMPVFITNGGDWSVQQKASDLCKYIEGVFHLTAAQRKLVMMFRDAEVWDAGILHPYRAGKKPAIERVLPHELLVDLVEAFATEPRSLHRVKICDRSVLMAQFEDDEDREKIALAPGTNFQDLGGTGTTADLVTVTESWHLPSDDEPEEETTDGRHCICIGTEWLVDEKWMKNYFPFVLYRSSPRLLGFWGQGAVERLQNIQAEINRLMILDQRSRWMASSFKVLIENSSKVVSQHLNNDVGTIIRYTNIPPQYVTPPPIDPSNEEKINSLIGKGYQQEGVSQLAANSMKPPGVNSGKALRAWSEIDDDRQQFLENEFEASALELARQLIDIGKEIYGEYKTHKVMFPSTTFVEEIDWKDINLDDDEYVMKAFPTSSLADDMTGRLSDIQELMQAGMISPRTGRKLLRTPDLEMADTLANAAEDLLHRVYETMLKQGPEGYRPPEPQMDLQLAMQLGTMYYNYASFHNAPEEIKAVVRRFMIAVSELLGTTAPPPPAAALAAGSPQAVPAPAPVSQLLPNVPGGAPAPAPVAEAA